MLESSCVGSSAGLFISIALSSALLDAFFGVWREQLGLVC